MTYGAGWKYANSVYLFADTAATKFSPPSTTHTSFGELHAQVRGEHVEESLLKLVPIASGAAVVFAGDVQLATVITEILKVEYRGISSLESLFSTITASAGPFALDRPVELLLAATSADNQPQLFHWDTARGLDSEMSAYYQIGSLTSFHAALTPQVLSAFVHHKLAPDRVLPMITAVVQSYGIHDNLTDMNVAGLIFGLRTEAGKVSWQDDTNFVVYDPNFLNSNYVSAFVRDNVLVVNSSLTNEIRAFANTISTPDPQEWLRLWTAPNKKQLESDRFRYWVFISTAARVITVLRRDNFDVESRYVQVKATGAGKFDMAMSPELMALLGQPLRDRNDGSLPFRLNFRND